MNKEQMLEVSDNAKAAFISKLSALGADKVAHGGSIMPRVVWAQCLVSALIDAGVVSSEEQADKVNVILASDLGNSSQLGAMLVKAGTIKMQAATEAASSFAAEIAKRAAAKA